MCDFYEPHRLTVLTIYIDIFIDPVITSANQKAGIHVSVGESQSELGSVTSLVKIWVAKTQAAAH